MLLSQSEIIGYVVLATAKRPLNQPSNSDEIVIWPI